VAPPVLTCQGLFGVGKALIDFGDFDVDDASDLDVELATANGVTLTGATLTSDGSLTIGADGINAFVDELVDANACTELLEEYEGFLGGPGNPSPSDFTPSFSSPRAVSLVLSDNGEAVCEVNLDVNFWRAQFRDTDDEFALGLLWTFTPGSADAPTLAVFGEDDSNDFEHARNVAAGFAAPTMIDCTQVSVAVPVASVVPASTLALTCEPAVASIGGTVTCTVSGGDPAATILWGASSSSAFAGQGVTLGSDGRGTFTFQVPAAVGDGPVLVELVDWDRTFTVTMSGTLVPVGVPAGEGTSTRGLLAALVAFAAAIGLLVRRRKVAAA
jgi:hypothetical protein